MTCRVSRQDARAWPAAAVEVASQDRVSDLEHEITRLRAQLASERALSDSLRERVALIEDQAGGYQVALAEAVVERDRARRDADRLSAELGDAVAAGGRAEDERDELQVEVEELRAALSAATDDWTTERERAERLATEREQALAALGDAAKARDELRAEVEALRADVELWHEAAGCWMRTVGHLQAELETALRRERADDAAQARALRATDEEVVS